MERTVYLLELEKVLVEATKRLDIEMLKEFYVHVEDYKHSRKLYLLEDVETALDTFKALGDTLLEPNLGYCKRCNKGCHGYQFVGNNSRNYVNLLFDNEADNIKGIVECGDLKVIKKVKELKKRIYLHEFNDPNSRDYLAF